MTTRQHEGFHGWKKAVHAIDRLLQDGNIFFLEIGDPEFGSLSGSQAREEPMVRTDPGPRGADDGSHRMSTAPRGRGVWNGYFGEGELVAEQADKGIQLVDGPVAFDAQMTFGDLGAADKGGCSFVSRFCIDLVSHCMTIRR